nr:tetratricopeptide repeat protein [Candidatus Ruthia endofausta]
MYSGAYNNLGNCYDQLNQTTRAISAYTQAIAINNQYVAAIYNYGNVYMKTNEPQLALKDLTLVLELDANFY